MLNSRDEFISKKIDNGLTIYSNYLERPWCYVVFLINAGLREQEKKGLAHLLEHVVIEDFATDNGKFKNAVTGLLSTNVQLFYLTEGIDQELVQEVADTLFKREIRQDTIERQKELIFQECKRKGVNKLKLKIREEKKRSLYPGSWVAGSVLGKWSEVKAIKKEDLQKFRRDYYNPENISIIFAGGIKPDKAFEMIESTDFTLERRGKKSYRPEPIISPEPPKNKKLVVRNSDYHKNSSGNFNTIGKVAKLSGKYSKATIDIMEEIVGHSIKKELREKNRWTYSINLATINFGPLYEFNFHCEFDSVSVNKIEEAIDSVLKEVKEKKDLFKSKKSGYLNYLLMRDYDVWDICKMAMDDIEIYGRVRPKEEIMKDIEEVKFDDIKEIVESIRNKSWNLLIVP